MNAAYIGIFSVGQHRLAPCCWGDEPYGVRELISLVRHLPPGSPLARAAGGGWDERTELAATNAELTHELLRAQLTAGGVPERKLPAPLRIPRPGHAAAPAAGSPRPARRAATADEAAAILAAAFPTMRR